MQSLIESTLLTMSSLEIAELCDKEHKHVTRDIRKLLEELGIDESRFGRIYIDQYGREQKCLELPQKLTYNLMMGYSSVLRERVITRWLELEAGVAPTALTLAHVEPEFKAGLSIAQLIGLKDNQAIISANRAVKRALGVNVLELFGHTSLPSEAPSRDYTATELGIMIADHYGDTDPHVGLSGQVVNRLMRDAGLHYRPGPSGWELTDLGKKYGHLVDVELEDRKTSKQGIKWFLSTLDLLLKFIEDEMMTGEIEEEVTKATKRVAAKRRKEAMAEMRLVQNTTEEVTQ